MTKTTGTRPWDASWLARAENYPERRSHGDGAYDVSDFAFAGCETLFEEGVQVWHPERLFIGDRVYVGHGTMLKGYYAADMRIGSGTWVGQMCFFHSAGGITIGRNVGVGPCVKIITSYHTEAGMETPILHSPIEFSGVEVGDDCDIGVGAILLPGTKLGVGVQVGAGAVVKGTFDDYSVVVGVPAREVKKRRGALERQRAVAERSGIYDDSGVWL